MQSLSDHTECNPVLFYTLLSTSFIQKGLKSLCGSQNEYITHNGVADNGEREESERMEYRHYFLSECSPKGSAGIFAGGAGLDIRECEIRACGMD